MSFLKSSLSLFHRTTPSVVFSRHITAFGQPHPSTHPHLLKEGEVNSGITREEFIHRRKSLAHKIIQSLEEKRISHSALSSLAAPSKANRHLVAISGGKQKKMVGNIPYFFRQSTDFRYMTGCLQPNCLLILDITPDGDHKAILFLQDPSKYEEKWEGPRTKPADAIDFFGVHESYPVSELESYLQSYRKEHNSNFLLWYNYLHPYHEDIHKVLLDFMHQSSTSQHVESPKRLLHELRVIKSPSEIDLMRQTCQVACQAIKETIRQSQRLSTEAQVFSMVDFHCRMRGAQFLAYPPVVASGDNANVIHYTNNNQRLDRTHMMLMDAGCEMHGYTSDITRTWPLDGTFSRNQKLLYEVVLDIQTRLLERLADWERNPVTIDGVYHSMQSLLGSHIRNLGLVKADNDDPRVSRYTNALCPHHASHYLGMDVHDTALVPRSIPLRPGMVFTVEPGLYIPKNTELEIPEEFKGIGIRIEDDVLITSDGIEVLSKEAPKTVRDIEAAMLN